MRKGSITLAAAVFTGLLLTAALTAPLSALANTPAIPAAPAEQAVRVGLGAGLTAAELSSSVGMLVVADGQVLLDLPAETPVSVTLAVGQMALDGLETPLAPPVRFVPKAPGFVLYKNKPYRGEFEVVLGSLGRLSLVNVVNLEDYLLGVVPKEMGPGWPPEALKAQAVASRTYALTNMGKRKAEGFDLYDNTSDQAYGGMQVESTATTDAVRATRGQVVTYQGHMVPTYYFASSGGHTENNEHIWTGGSPAPYLRGVPDYDNLPANTRYTWSYSFTPVEFAQKLKAAGYDVGEVRSVTAGAPGAGDWRPTTWSVQGSTGQVTLNMLQMRTALGLWAPPRTIVAQSEGATAVSAPPPATTPTPPPPAPEQVAAPVYVLGADGRLVQRQVGGSYVLSADGLTQRSDGPAVALGAGNVAIVGNLVAVQPTPADPAPAPAPTPTPTPAPQPTPVKVTGYTVEGGGYGHGVGLSQWGARGMALDGKTYTQILTHFYTGTKVETR